MAISGSVAVRAALSYIFKKTAGFFIFIFFFYSANFLMKEKGKGFNCSMASTGVSKRVIR